MFTLTFKTDNAAFADDPTGEVSAVLDRLATVMSVESSDQPLVDRPVFDTFGNRIGEFTYTPEGE